jgi:acetolactate synthase-1/2/3 large subunit
MVSGRPGPVAVEMPWDMFPATADVTPMDPLGKRANPVPDPDKIAALAKLVDGARAPMIWIGGGAVDAGPEILALAEKIGAPVVSFRMGKGVVDSRHPLSLNTVGGFELWDKTDLLIGIGTRLDVPIARWAPAPAGLKTARIDIDPIEHRRLSVDVAIVADAADGTRALTALVKSKDDPARRAAVAAAKAAALAAIQKADPQYSFMKVLREVLPDDGIVVDEVTQLGYIIWYGYPVHQPRRLISSGFSGTLGYGFPTALGVKVANPDRPVVSVTGDGGFLFGGSDLATAKQFGINLVTVVVNNSSYGNVQRDQQRLYEGRHSGAVLTNPDFQAYARAFGVGAWRVETADAFRGALKEALASDAPAVVEVMSDITKDYPPYKFHQPRLP